MTFSFSTVVVGTILVVVQLLAALPWVLLILFNPEEIRALLRTMGEAATMSRRVGLKAVAAIPGVLAGLVLLGWGLMMALSQGGGEGGGMVYGAILQLQLTIDLFVILFAVLLKVWPKGGAVAQAAFRESVRQPMFWLLFGIAFTLMMVSPFIPYFTFGEDHIMVKELGYDTIMFVAAIFGTLAASMFVSDEIEGRTAITMMSKPVSRRQFLLGKFVGILTAIMLMMGLLACWFQGVMLFKAWFDRLDPTPTPTWVLAALGKLSLPPGSVVNYLRGIGLWADLTFDTLPGLVLSLWLVTVLVALAVALATRVPMVVNTCVIASIYVLANLSPVLVSIGQKAQQQKDAGAVAQILSFTSQLFDTLLPGLSYFRVGPAVVSDTPLPTGEFWAYVGSASLYGAMYTGILLLIGLILFEDRDLA
jgi:ABC-type transport system involved in multi-copper enzyme maturation permease subunit